MKLFDKLNLDLKKKFGNFGQKVRKFLPYTLAIVPGGLGIAMWYSNAQRQAKLTNQINQAVATMEAEQRNADARNEFISQMTGIDKDTIQETTNQAREAVDKAYEEAVAKGEAENFDYNQVYDNALQSALGMDTDTFAQLKDSVIQAAVTYDYETVSQNAHNTANAEIYSAMGWETEEQAQAGLENLRDSALQGNQTAQTILENISQRTSEIVENMQFDAQYDHWLGTLPEYADTNIVADAVQEVTTTQMMGDTWTDAVLIAAAVAGAALVGRVLPMFQAKDSLDKKKAVAAVEEHYTTASTSTAKPTARSARTGLRDAEEGFYVGEKVSGEQQERQ